MRKILSAVVAAVYFSVNCVLAHSTEANFWASRRAASQQVKGETAKLEEGDTVQRGNVLLAQLPMASPVDLARGKVDSAQDLVADGGRTPFTIGPKAGDWLGKMVSPYGSVRDVYLSPKKDAPFIVHIQDGHGIEEAQRNISSMIEIMGQEPKIQLVGLEAAWGPFSLQPYRDYPDANITKEIADFFLKKGLIAGPEYAGLTLPTAPDFFGAEDKTLYDANVLALKTAYKTKKAALTQLGVVVNNVGVLKSQRYSDQLKTFDGHFEGYHSEKEKLAVYVRYLVETHRSLKIPHPALRGPSDPGPIRPVANASHWQARPFPQEGKENRDFPSPLGRLVAERPAPGAPEALMRGQGEGSVPNLELLVRALDEEDRLNFKLVEKERRDLVEQLANKLNVQQMQDLVAKSVDYRAGRVGYGDYHSHLINVCRQHGIGVGQWAHLNRYISYVMLADKIDKNGLLEEMDALDRSIPERLAKTAAEKKLVSVVYDLTLMAKLLRHEMAPTDWAAYEKRVGEIHRLGDRLNELDPTGKWESLSAITLKPFEDFCRYATQRNNALTDNLLRRMGETQAKSAVLVAGGFHTEGLSALLRQKQVSYVVVTPKITEIPRDNKYLDLLASDPVPLEKQLAGDRIYLAKVVGMTEKSTAGLMNAIQQVAQLKKALVDMGNGYAITTDGAYPGAKVLFELSDGRKIYFVTNFKQEKLFMNFTSRLVNGSILVVKTLSIRFLSMMNAISLPATVKEDAIMLLGALGLIGGPLVSFAILLLMHIPNLIRILSDEDSSTGKRILRLVTLFSALTILQLLWVDWAGSLDTISNFKAIEIAGGISLIHLFYSYVAKNGKWLRGAQATSEFLDKKSSSQFDHERLANSAYYDPRNSKIQEAWSSALIRHNEDGTMSRVRPDYFDEWYGGGGVTAEVGKHYDAHGIAKSNPLGGLLNLLENGIDPTHSFHTAPLNPARNVGPGLGSSNGAYKDGPFIVLGERGKFISESGITKVLVADSVAGIIPALSERFPNVQFIPYSQAQTELSREWDGDPKPAATIKALMPLYHWMGRTFNPQWSRIPAREKLEQIIEVYAPFVESVLFGVVFGGTLALLGFLGIDLSTLQTVGLWGAFNGIFALSHRTFYVLENGEWKEKPLADVGKSTHLTLWAAGLGVHLPLLGMLLTPAAFSVPFFLAVFVSSALSSGFHRFYNKWVARPLGLPALTGVRSDFNRARSLLFLLLKDLDDRDVFRIHSELITRYPSYKESAGELNSAASISTFWNQHLATTVGRSNDDSWTDFKNSLLSLSNPRISFIQDDPFSSGGFGEARLIKINGKDFILKTARHGQDKIPLLDAIFNIGSLLYEEKQLKSMKKLIKENKIPHVVPIHVGGGISNGRNFIVMERIKGENLNANSQISLQEALRIIDAVRWFHKNNKVHGDLKPLNIMIASEGAFLLDLGTTKQVGTKIAWDNVSTQEFSTGLDETRRGKNFNTDIYQLAATLVTAMNEDDLTRPKIFRVLERALTGFELPTHTAFPTGFDTSEFRPSAEEMYVEFIRSIEDQEQPEPNPFNKQKMIGELQIAKAWNWAEMQTLNGGVNNIFYFVLRFFTSEKFAKAWGMRLLPVEISVLGWAGWMASGWAQAVFGALALDPTFMGAALMAAGILVFRGLHFALDKVWARNHPAQGPPSTTFWLNTARMMPYAMLPVLAASPVAFLVAFSVLAYDHFAFDLKQLLNRDLPLSNTAKLLVVSMVSATFAVVIAPIIVSNLASPMGTFFLVSLAAQVFDPVTMQSFSENPASGLFALSVGTVSNFSTYALSMGWAPMALLGFATSALLSNTRWLPSLSVAQNYLSAYGRLGENHSLNTYSSIEDYESFLIDGPHSLLTRGRLARNLEIARHTSGVKSVFYLGAGTDLTHVLTSFPDATHVTLSGNNYGTITAESIKNAMTTSHGLTGRSNELLTAYKESVSNNGFAGTSLVQNPVMQSSFLALELLSLGVQVGTIRSESGGGISFEVPGLLGRPSRRVSIVFKNNAFNGSPVQMNTGEQIYDGFFAKAIDGIQPYFMGVFSALADRLSSSLTVVSDRAVPDNMDDIGFREISKVTVSDEDSGSYGNAFQVVKLNRFPTPPKENELAAKSVVALIESRKLAKLAINLKYNFEGTDYRPTFELQGETSRNDIDSAIRILGAANVSVQVAEEYGRQLALAEGNGTQKVAVLHGIASWEEKTRTIALAVVRGMLMAGKPVLIVAEAGFDTAIINYSGQTPIEVLNIAELNADLMNTVETQRSNRDVPLASTVLIREEDRAVLDGTNYSALTFEGISRAIQNALETLIATLRAA